MAATARPQKQRSVDISRNAELIHSPVEVLHQYCKDLKDWPDSWAGSNRDIPIGTALVEEFKVLLLAPWWELVWGKQSVCWEWRLQGRLSQAFQVPLQPMQRLHG